MVLLVKRSTSRAAHNQQRLTGAFSTTAAEPDPTPDAGAGLAEPGSCTVSEAVARIQRALDRPDLQDVWVKGEISGFKEAGSGHWYFALKDEHAVLQCAMWKQRNARVRFTPDDGMAVLARGRIDVYAPRGSVQLIVDELRPEGMGSLAAQFEQLKRKLQAEGVFDEARKRAIPEFPRVIGVVTSRSGAVWHDIQREATRRFPGIHLILRPVRVQGEGAAEEVARAIELFNTRQAADVLIVGRGGGSMEDLWAFNEETVVRAIAASDIPVISAVGHETDFTLADFAADARAATPTQAAAIATPDALAIAGALAEWESRAARALTRRRDEARRRVDEAWERLAMTMHRVYERKVALLGERAASLSALSPLDVLARGYAVATGEDGKVVRSVRAVRVGDALDVRLADGRVRTKVEEVDSGDGEG